MIERKNTDDILRWSTFRAANPEVAGASTKLWGDVDHLKQQLLAPTPHIPPELNSRAKLQGLPDIAESTVNEKRRIGVKDAIEVVAGGICYTLQEARLEIVRRAIKKIRS